MAEQWIPCSEAIRLLAQLYDQSDRYADYEISLLVAADTLLNRLANDAMQARAGKAEMSWGNPLMEENAKYYNNENIPSSFWRSLKRCEESERELDWVVGDFSYMNGSNDHCFWGSAFNVQIDMAGLPGSMTTSAAFDAPASTEPRGAGRPARFDWPDAVLSIFGLIYRGELKPANQAEVERALLSHLSDGQSSPSESTVRPYAKKIWDEFSKA
jgi:hypothetical protein